MAWRRRVSVFDPILEQVERPLRVRDYVPKLQEVEWRQAESVHM
jgi:hypothetical protein